MDNVLKFLRILNQLVWFLVGLITLIAIFFVWRAAPWKNIPDLLGSVSGGVINQISGGGQEVDPSKWTPEVRSCVVKALGESRVNELESGSKPNESDMTNAASCFNNNDGPQTTAPGNTVKPGGSGGPSDPSPQVVK